MRREPLTWTALMLVAGCLGCSSSGTGEAPDACAERAGRTVRNVLGGTGVALGCAYVRGPARLLELYSVRDAGGPCIVVAGLEGGLRACGRAPSERVPAVRRAISAGPVVRRSSEAPVEVYGETSANVGRVVLRYSLPRGGHGTTRATLVEASDARALEAAGIREAFGFFVGDVPASAYRVVAEALDRSGRSLGSAGYSDMWHMPATAFIAEER